MVVSVREVTEAEAQGKIKAIYEDAKAVLGVPFVPAIFRGLAIYPRFLELAWRNLKPNASTVYFGRSANQLRSAAFDLSGQNIDGLREPRSFDEMSEIDQAAMRQVVAIFGYADAKALLSSAALRAGVNGQVPKIRRLSAEDMRQASLDAAPLQDETVRLLEAQGLREGPFIPEDVRRVLGLKVLPSEYAAVARFPAVLEASWSLLRQTDAATSFRSARGMLLSQARDSVEALPFRMEISATAARQAGLAEDEIDDIKRLLDGFEGTYGTIGLLQAMIRHEVESS